MRLNIYPYCNKQNIIFVDGAEPPKSYSNIMLAMAPHGILTIGYTCLVSSIEMEKTDIKWLVTDFLKI